MKRSLLLFTIAIFSSCAHVSISESDYVGTWLVTRNDGYLEKLSIFSNHNAEFGGREFSNFSWDVLEGELQLKYVKNNKTEVLAYKLSADKLEMNSTKNEWYSNEIHFSAKKISPNPNESFNLFEVAQVSKNSKVWECVNVGSGGQVYATVLQTSLSLDLCKSQCDSHIETWHRAGINNDEFCK